MYTYEDTVIDGAHERSAPVISDESGDRSHRTCRSSLITSYSVIRQILASRLQTNWTGTGRGKPFVEDELSLIER